MLHSADQTRYVMLHSADQTRYVYNDAPFEQSQLTRSTDRYCTIVAFTQTRSTYIYSTRSTYTYS